MSTHLLRTLVCALGTALLAGAAPDFAAAQAPQGRYTQLHAFTAAEGSSFTGRLLALPDGRLVGTAPAGGEFGRGTIVVLKRGAAAARVLHSFSGKPADGDKPVAGLVVGPDGQLWGTTQYGGRGNAGTIFRVGPGGRLHIVHMFGRDVGGGSGPVTSLTLASDGFLYGTTYGGGPSGRGTVFRLEADGSVTTLWAMGPGEARALQGRLMQGSDGLLYGTSSFGGANERGTVFSLATDGSARRILHSFSGADGWDGAGGVIEAGDGLLYGTTSLGGAFDLGAAFRLARDGSGFTLLHSFTRSRDDGWGPFGELIETSPGVFVGTTALGGRFDAGTVFQMLAGGEVTLLHTFTGRPKPDGKVDGSAPFATLTPLGTETLLGVTQSGGVNGAGTVFKLHAK